MSLGKNLEYNMIVKAIGFVVSLFFFLSAVNYIDRPTAYYSTITQDCVMVEDSLGENRDCSYIKTLERKGVKYDIVWN